MKLIFLMDRLQKAEFNWTETEKSLLLGMNNIGMMIAASLSGVVVHEIGGVTLLSVSKFGEALVTLSSPFVANINVYLFVSLRFFLGIFEVQ